MALSKFQSGHEIAPPLNAIYVLEARDEGVRPPQIELLSPAGGLRELLRYRYGLFALPLEQIEMEYLQLSELARTVPIRRLHRPNDLGSLPQTASAVLRDLKVGVHD